MTIDRIALKELVEKGSDADLLREMIAFIASRMMELEVEGLTGAGHGERSWLCDGAGIHRPDDADTVSEGRALSRWHGQHDRRHHLYGST